MKAFCKIRSFRFARFASLSLIVLISSFLFAGQLDLPVDGYRPPTEVAGVISEDTVWTKAGSPYIVRSTVTISVDAVLNVEPGAEIYFVQNQELIVRGMLRAVGSQDAPIIFRGTVEIPGWWRAIHIQNEGSAILEWCEISFGGATHGAGVLKTGSGGLRLANSTIRRTNGDGLRVAAGYSFFESLGNRFLYNNNGVRAGTNVSFFDRTSTFTGNSVDIHLDGGTINTVVKWGTSSDYSMVLGGDVTISPGALLEIERGTVLKFRQGNRLMVNGLLEAVGSEDEPIYFTDWRDDSVGGDANRDGTETLPEAGWWRSINVSNDGSAVLRHCVISYAGRSDGAALLKSGNGSLTVTETRIINTAGEGLRIAAGYSSFAHANNSYADNSIGVRVSINASFDDKTSSFEGNALDIQLDGGTINTGVKWGASSDYSMVLAGDITVSEGAVLEIVTGTVLKLRQNNRILVNGHLQAIGSEEKPIYFTDWRDDSVGGDANRDGTETMPEAGWWRSISLLNAGSAYLEWCVVTYSGSRDGAGIIKGSTGALSLVNTTVRNSSGDGIRIDNSAGGTVISDSILRDNSGAGLFYRSDGVTVERSLFKSNDVGIRLSANCSLMIDGSSHFEDNNRDVQIDAGTISGEVSWSVPGDLSVFLTGNTTIAGGAGLNIRSGTILKLAQNTLLTVYGYLDAKGTEEKPVHITDWRDDSVGGDANRDGEDTVAEPGWWRSINVINEGSISLDWVTISYAQSGIAKSGSGSLAISNSTIRDMTGDALRLAAGYSSLEFRRNSFINCTTGVRLGINTSFDDSLAFFSGNNIDVYMDGGTISTDITLGLGSDYSFYISGELSVSKGSSLYIMPGTVLKFARYRGLRVSGNLYAMGEFDRPVYFTDWRDDSVGGDANRDGGETVPEPGWWRSIYIQEAGNAELKWCNVIYGGYADRTGVFKTGTGSLSIEDSSFSMTAGDGLHISSSVGIIEISRSSFADNTNGAAMTKENTPLIFSECLFINNAAFGLKNDGTTEVLAMDCWWGDNTGPYHVSLNPGGRGDQVSGNVAFDPWIGKDELDEEEQQIEQYMDEHSVDLVGWTSYSSDGLCFEVPAYWHNDTEEYTRYASGDDNWKALGRWYDAEPGFERVFFVLARVNPGSLEDEKADLKEDMEVLQEFESEIAGMPGVWLILTAPEQDVERVIFAHQFGTGEDGMALSIGFGVREIDWSDIEEIYERIMSSLRYCEY